MCLCLNFLYKNQNLTAEQIAMKFGKEVVLKGRKNFFQGGVHHHTQKTLGMGPEKCLFVPLEPQQYILAKTLHSKHCRAPPI